MPHDPTPRAAASDPPAISVIIPHLNQPELLERCLAALQAQTFAQTFAPSRVEIIVIDNGSREPPEAVVRRFANATLVVEAEPGPGPARNRGVALSRAPILAFTDADCLPDPDWLTSMAARFDADPELRIVGGNVRIYIETPGDPTAAEAFQMLYAFRQEQYIARQNFSVTANMAIRREVFDAVGPFAGLDTVEDLDWGQRASRLGCRIIYAPEMLVLHPARRTMGELRSVWDRHIAHFYRLKAKGFGGKVRWALSIPLIALSPLAEAQHILRTDRVASARERWLIFRGLTEVRLYRAFRMTTLLLGARMGGAARWNRG